MTPLQWLAAAWLVGVVGMASWTLWRWRKTFAWHDVVLVILLVIVGMGVAVALWTLPAHARPVFVRKADGRTTIMVERAVTAAPVTLTYTIPAFQALPGSLTCAPDASQAAHCDSVRVLAFRRFPHPWDTAAWVAAQQSGWFDPYVVRTKYIGGLSGQDTIRCPLLPVGYGVRVQAKNAAGWCPCLSNLTRGVNP